MSDRTESDPTNAASALAGRRLMGIGLDWFLCLVISSAFFVQPEYQDTTGLERILVAGSPLATLAIWAAQHFVLVALLGTTIGHRLVGVRVVREDGGRFVGPIKAAGRTVLLALVIPAVVWDSEGRGLHDRLMGTRVESTRKDAS